MISTPHFPPEDAAALLAWYRDMGVDVAVEDVAQDRFVASASEVRPVERSQAPPPPLERPLPGIDAPPPPPPAAFTRSLEASEIDAREAARSAATLADLRAILEAYDGIALRRTATRLVFADGNPAARLMLVGEAPGRDEDREGLAFVGRAGQLLDRMLAAIGIDREGAYIANVVPWRPPGNRTPTPQETLLCLPFIRRQIELADPDVLVLLGGSAAAALTGAKDGILKLRGRWLDYDTGKRTIKAMPTLHPAYLLRTPLQKRLAWRDLLEVKAELSRGSQPPPQ